MPVGFRAQPGFLSGGFLPRTDGSTGAGSTLRLADDGWNTAHLPRRHAQAIWKLLYTTGVGDVRILSEAQFVLLAPGFLLLLVSIALLTRDDRLVAGVGGRPTMLALAVWKIPFLIVTTVCSIGAYGLLTYIAFRRGAPLAGALFIAAVLYLFAMSGLSSGEQTVARQWIEEGINSAGQSAFAVGSYFLYRTYRRTAGDMGHV
jgi:hypothetical protein